MDKEARKKLTIIVAAVIAFLAIILLVQLLFFKPSETSKIDDVISKSIDNKKVTSTIVMTDGDWTLAKSEMESAKSDNAAYTILKKEKSSEKVMLGPGTSFGVDEMYDLGVPDKFLRFFYKDATMWIHLSSFTKEYSTSWAVYPQSYITDFSMDKKMELKRIIIDKTSVNGRIDGVRSDNPRQYAGFKFTINDDHEVYTFEMSMSELDVEAHIYDDRGVTIYQKTDGRNGAEAEPQYI